jgi:hypothetical protein
MAVERRERVIAIGIGSTGNGRNPTINGRRQPSCGDTSRMNREVHVRFCEGLGVEFPGPTRPTRTRRPPASGSAYWGAGISLNRTIASLARLNQTAQRRTPHQHHAPWRWQTTMG